MKTVKHSKITIVLIFCGCAVLGATSVCAGTKGTLIDAVAAADRAADAAVAAIRTPEELKAKQDEWRAAWLAGLGGLPAEKTPLNAKVGPVVKCDGFTLQNVLFESQLGVYVVGHLCLPDAPAFKPPYPAVLMANGHANESVLAPRYAAHLAMMARAGFAAFSWDPISQGERRQSEKKFDYADNCSTEHTRLGARGWLVGWNFARFEIWDGIRALDYLETRKEIDCSKVGICGTSGGGTQSAYLQALDSRIKVAFPNCFVSSIRAVFGDRGCHDAEQFFFNQLNVGVNHAAILAMGCPRVALATGSRWKDYFPHAGAVDTFAVYSNLVSRLTSSASQPSQPPKLSKPSQPSKLSKPSQPSQPSPWHFHCDGPHGLPLPTRQAQVDWMRHCLAETANGRDARSPMKCVRPLEDYWALSTGDHSGTNDPCASAPLPFRAADTFFTPTHQVRDLKGFKSIYALIAERAKELAAKRGKKTREQLREIVRRRAGIRMLGGGTLDFTTSFDWWYLKGPWGHKAENKAAILATLGRSYVGEKAEEILRKSANEVRANGGKPIVLRAKGWDCIAAAHAYAAEPQLFSAIVLEDRPPSWTELVTNPDPKNDSVAIGVWGALEEYDWTDLVPPDENLLYDGKLVPSCTWLWTGRPIEIETDLGGEREIGGVRWWSGRSWISSGAKKASFYGLVGEANGQDVSGWIELAKNVEFRPAHTFKESFATWKPVRCRKVKMVVGETWATHYGYYMWYMHLATPRIRQLFDTPPYTVNDPRQATLQIAELEYFGAEAPIDLPRPNAGHEIAYPESRLVRDWMYQSCAVSNVSHCANVEADTTKPDPLGESVGERFSVSEITASVSRLASSPSPWLAERLAARREFLKAFREKCPEFIYVKHLVIGNSIMHATDDMTDASFLEWRGIPDYKTGSQLVRARINADGTVSQELLWDEPNGIIRDPSLSADATYVVFSKRSSMERDNYHLWRMDLATKRLVQLTFEPTMPQRLVPGQTNDFPLVCADTEPCVLPDGSIVFQSTRVCHSVDCWPLPTTNLYRCDPDGANIRRIGFDQIQTFYPQLLDDGRLAYTRWEYNDRNASGFQQLCSMNPDGTRQMGLFGNNSEFPFSIIHARGIPGTSKLIGLSCGHHVAQKGKLVEMAPAEGDDYESQTYDPAKSVYGMNTNDIVYTDFPGGPFTVKWTPYDNPCGPAVTNVPAMRYLAGASMDNRPGRVPVRYPKDYHYNVYDMHTQFGPQWAYPYALDEDRFLVSFMPEGCRYYRGPYSSRFGIYAMDASGRRELLAFDWGNHCMQPIAIKPRPRTGRRLIRKLDYRKGFGTFYIQDVYHGAAVKGLKRGSVRRLRVVALEYRPVHNGWNWQYGWHSSQGKIGTPIAVGNGCYDVKHVFGEADVEEDGSCLFKCPARAPVYFQLIDKDGLCLQTMRSWTTLMPGEANSCIGCHERPNEASAPQDVIALRKPPQDLKPAVPGAPRHPLLERLEKEGPLASLENWMGVNRPMKTPVADILAKGIPPEERGDGVGFVKDIQPIFDRLMRDHPNEKILGLDLRDVPAKLPATDDRSMRTYSEAYLQFTEKGKGTDNVNFAHGLSFVPFKPPCSFGAIRSKWYHALAPLLTDAERRTLAMWIDLAIPYCSCYTERHTWDAWHQQRYLYTYDKRIFSYWLELDEIRKSYGLGSVPLTGFVPNVTEPRKQRRWDE